MDIRYFTPSKLYSFLFRPQIKHLSISKIISLKCKKTNVELTFSELKNITLNKKLYFYEIVLELINGNKFFFKGLNENTAANAYEILEKLYFNSLIIPKWPNIISVHKSWIDLLGASVYINNNRYISWKNECTHIQSYIPDHPSFLEFIDTDKREILTELTSAFKSGTELIKNRNERFVSAELVKWNDFFNSVESNPLTENQRAAVVHDEDNNLVIAGAGTGKTSTIIAKVGYILKCGLANPEEILLLAFTKKAAQEIKERIEKKFAVSLNIRTFHSLGLEILAHAEQCKPSLCKEAEDEVKMRQTLEELTHKLLASADFRRKYIDFRVFYSIPYKPAWKFDTMADYKEHLNESNLRSLSGDWVKSFEECAIANWLYLNGIKFEYEPKYKFQVADKEHHQYRPDFYLVDNDIYIEHFAINRSGKTPKWIDEKKYKAQMEWKRNLHRERGTRLLETYSWQHEKGILLEELEKKLQKSGIKPCPIPDENVFKRLNELGVIDPVAQLIATFQSLFKGSAQSRQDIDKKAKSDDLRTKLFLEIFFAVNDLYEERNRKKGDVDFNDMITKACSYVNSGQYQPIFKYIMVDEFQDISQGRAQLLLSLREQKADSRLFCVGDDWQSIYRFTGSDISLMTHFEQNFGYTKKTYLDKTFRFNNQIEAISTRFILKNPSQLRKRLQPYSNTNVPAVILRLKEMRKDYIGDILSEIRNENDKNASVFILNRYNFLIPDREFQKNLSNQYKNLEVSYLTAHSAKGLEADYVIIDNINSGLYGFPTQIIDDPLLDLILPEPDKHENGEERRLFYVAITRARKKVYLVADKSGYSIFVKELINDKEYKIEVLGETGENTSNCPCCGSGFLVPRTNGHSYSFYGCSNYPLCKYSEDVCPKCRKGPYVKNNGCFQCVECGTTSKLCPQCGVGRLVEKKGQYGPFLGCSMFFSEWDKCSYIEKM